MRRGAGAVAGAALVLAAVLAAGPLYVASVGAAAVQGQFDERCPTRIGLSLPGSPGFEPDRMAAAVAPALAAAGDHVRSGRLTERLEEIFRLTNVPADADERVRLLHRAGGTDDVEVVDGPDGDGLWVPAAWAASAGLGPGSSIEFLIGGHPFSLRVAATYRDLVAVVPPREWCTQSDLLRPSPGGDAPPALLLFDDASFATLRPEIRVLLDVVDEIEVDPAGLTLAGADRLRAVFDEASRLALDRARAATPGLPLNLLPQPTTELPFVVRRANGIVDLVEANVGPVRLAGGLAGVALAVAAGALATRRRRGELVTRALRGEGPVRLGLRVGLEALPPVAAGSVAGAFVALAAVRVLGPAPDLGPVRGVLLGSAAATLGLALVAVAVAAGVDARRLVDPPRPRSLPRWLRAVPWELAPLGLAVAAGLRLVDVGGALFVGDETRGADAVALAFPVLAAVAAALVIVRPVARLARLLRRRPRGLRRDAALVLGARRLAHDPAGAAGVAAAVALASATAVLGISFAASAETALRTKVDTFVGAEVAATIVVPPALGDVEVPASMQGRATLAGQIGVRAGSQNVDLLVVDPATFADGADLTAAQVGLLDDLVPTGAGEPAAALVVGPLPEPVLRLANDRTLAITPVATPAVFPTLKRAATLVVVRRDAVPPELGLAGLVLAHGDPEAVETALRADGRLVTGVTSPDEVVSAVSYSAVRWAYGTLQAFGGLVVVVLVGVELSVAAARAPLRRLAEVLTAAMGLGRRRALAAVVLEHGAPLAVGAGVGVAVARAVASIAVPHLDSARTIPPGAVALVPASAVVAVLAVGTAAVALAATTSRLTARRARPVEVLRGG